MADRPVNVAHLERRIRGALRQVEVVDRRLRGLLLDLFVSRTARASRETRRPPGDDHAA